MWVVGFVLIMTAINLKSVNIVANFNTLFVLAQVMIIVVFIVLVIHGLHKGKGRHRLEPAALYQRKRTLAADYYRRHHPLFFIPGL